MFRRPSLLLVAGLLAWPSSVAGSGDEPFRTVRLPVCADVGICAHRREVHLNTGGAPTIRLKGIQHYYLFDVDANALAGRAIRSATLRLNVVRGDLRKVSVCTVPTPWAEGTAAGDRQTGSACYTHARYPDVPWTRHGGTLLEATFNNPHMLWETVDVDKRPDGWVEVAVPPRMVLALAAGLSHGLVLAEETGQTFENHDVHTRHFAPARPVLVVTGHKARAGSPNAKEYARRLLVEPGLCSPWGRGHRFHRARWWSMRGVGKTLWTRDVGPHENAFFARELRLPGWDRARRVRQAYRCVSLTGRGRLFVLDSLPDVDANGTWRVWTCIEDDRGVYLGPVAQAEASYDDKMRFGADFPDYAKEIGRDIDGEVVGSHVEGKGGWRARRMGVVELRSPRDGPADETGRFDVPLALRNATFASLVTLHPPRGEARGVSASVTVLPAPSQASEPGGRSGRPGAPPGPASVCRLWSVPSGARWVPEVCVPLADREAFEIPWALNRVPGQRNQTLLVEVWVPASTTPGRYVATLRVRAGGPGVRGDGSQVLSVALPFDVGAAVLGEEFHVAGDMNTYSSPAGAMGVRATDPQAFYEMERKYYRLAHRHRMTLSVLPYNQAGEVHWRSAPAVVGEGARTRLTGWDAWDARYGPLLSGEAFSAEAGYVGPGAGRPIRHLYLPFHENWPMKLAEHFCPWPPPREYDALMKWTAGLPLDPNETLDAAYDAGFVAALRDARGHLARRGWTRTRYQVYLNNKAMYRDPRRGGRGVSLWSLDEPMFAGDFLALRHFGRLTREALSGEPNSPVAIDYRVDISRPTHQRTWLDGVVDLNVCADQLYDQRHHVLYRRLLLGERYWNYRMPPSFGRDNQPWATWPVRSYCWGAIGTLPWQTIASDGDLRKADATALMYPGRKVGHDGPLASLRMKAWREGLQTAELLHRLGTSGRRDLAPLALPCDAHLRALVGQATGLDGWQGGFDPPAGSGIVTFAGWTHRAHHRLRRAVEAILAGSAPRAAPLDVEALP